ncbi:MAG: glycine zipper 2TM domain-containing protein [Cytophagaceae bacterium]|nr:MAG: glycine zipper 2TM domain-containing protein [Cytophagaceae bacterium]
MKKFLIALAMAATTLGSAGVADAQYYGRHGYSQRHYDGYRSYRTRPYNYRHYDRNYYDRNRSYAWRGNDGRYYCRRSDGSTGTIIGAIGGALLGRTLDTDGDRTLGTVLGGAGGALAGRSIDRNKCR